MSAGFAAAPAPAGWEAGLELSFESRRGRTILAHSAHRGPLRVQRPFHPEPDGACHVYLLHPPGGVVGGDLLELRVSSRGEGRALLTTPGATKLYRSLGPEARLAQHFSLPAGFVCEWLPQETIVFDGARARLSTHVRLARGASYAGWELLCLGRPAAGERFRHGSLRVEYRIERAGELQWIERGRFTGGEAALEAAWGLAGHAVLATFVMAPAREPDDSWVERARAALTVADGSIAVTRVSGVVIVRYLGAHAHVATAQFRNVWRALRPLYAGSEAVLPRIWHT